MTPVSSGRVLVTGASRGIGRSVVAALAARRARVVAVGRDRNALQSVAAINPSRVLPLVADLDDLETRESLVRRVTDVLGGLDGVVHSVGIARHAKVGAITDADLRAQLETNFVAPLMISQAAALKMREQRQGGAIVHIASTLGMHPAPGTTAYAASKAALLACTKALAAELAPDGIRVNAVAPGVVDTDMVRALRLDPGERAPVGVEREARVHRQLATLEKLHPLGRLGRPEDVAQAVLYLLDATWATGTTLVVDGGLLVGS